MGEGTLNTLVYDYLTNVNPKAANLFKKDAKPKALAVGSPGMKEIYTFFEANSPAAKKKKSVIAVVKAAEKEDEAEEDSDEEEAAAPAVNGAAVNGDAEDDDSDSDEEEDEETKKTNGAVVNGDAEEDDSDSDEEDEAGEVTEVGEEAEGVATSVAIIRGNNLTESISILLSGFIQFFFFPVA